jgi:hypothetical protein
MACRKAWYFPLLIFRFIDELIDYLVSTLSFTLPSVLFEKTCVELSLLVNRQSSKN